MTMKIALPSKGLEEPTLEVLRAAKITVTRKSRRAVNARISGAPGISEAAFIRPSLVPDLVAAGKVDIGITGMDIIRERQGAEDFIILGKFSYSRASDVPTRCVLFTKANNPVNSVEELPQDCEVATEYPAETRMYLEAHGKRAKLPRFDGSVESLVTLGMYDFGVALTETGSTLIENGMKIIAEIFTSHTVLIARKDRLSETQIEQAKFFVRLMAGVLAARGKTFLFMNARADAEEAIKRILPSMKSPTIQKLGDPDYISIATVVADEVINELTYRLEQLGASDFVRLPPDCII
ncbi:MAG: hypothetical protein RIQ56_53 [Candidatus Parcubacteria bacterium]|jgi:ATP phosphoribosyltransferase